MESKQMQRSGMSNGETMKILILGCGHAGKSTLLNHLKLLTNPGFVDEQAQSMKELLPESILYDMSDLLGQMDNKKIDFVEPERLRDKAFFIRFRNKKGNHCQAELASTIKRLSLDMGVQLYLQMFSHAADSTRYFFANAERIFNAKYVPEREDLLRCASPTLGMVKTSITYQGTEMVCYDCGGGDSGLRKITPFFEGSHFLFYCVSLDEYDKKNDDDPLKNKFTKVQNSLTASLERFETLLSLAAFSQTKIKIIFTKLDLFTMKIRHEALNKYFSGFSGSNTVDECLHFIQTMFLSKISTNLKVDVSFISAIEIYDVSGILHSLFDKAHDARNNV